MLSSLEFNQLINKATHITGYSESLIDVDLCKNNDIVENICVSETPFSYHECIGGILKCAKPKISPGLVLY